MNKIAILLVASLACANASPFWPFSSSSEEDTETARITGSDLGEAFETAKAAVGNLLEAGFKRDEEAKKQLKAYLAHLFRIPEFVEEELPNSESVLPVESDDASIAAIETQNEVEAAAESDEETSESLEAPLADSEIETAAESTASADSEDEASEGLEVALADSDDEE